MNNSIIKSNLIVKLPKGVYQLPAGQLVGFGPFHPGGYGWCYNCYVAECQHVEAVYQAWLDGVSVAAQSMPFNGYHADAVPAPPISQVEVTQADIDAMEQGNKPGAWRAKSKEEMPSGWLGSRVL